MIKFSQKGDAIEFTNKILGAVRGPTKVKAGFPSGKADSDILARATYNEFGTSRGIPERPFLRGAMRENQESYRALMHSAALAVIQEQVSIQEALERLGAQAQGDIQASITKLSDPPNAPSTIRRKGSANPLVDTGQMRQSVTYEVVDE